MPALPLILLTILLVLFLLLVWVLVIWVVLVAYVHDFGYPTKNIADLLPKKENYKVLALYPHPDDETMAAGGLISKLAHNPDFHVKIVSATAGGSGDEILKLPPNELIPIRQQELKNAVAHLGVIDRDLEIWDFEDGKLQQTKEKLSEKVKKEIDRYQPDLILTYDHSGLYGHPDHITLAQVIEDAIATKTSPLVLYSTLPKKILKRHRLPVHMGKGEIPNDPEFKVNVWKYVLNRYKAGRAHKSQKLNHKFPLWFKVIVLGGYEYYTTRF